MKHLFLDLEDTVITPVMNGWFNTLLINVDKIKAVQAHFKPDFVNIFSFAIWDEQQLHGFNYGTRPMIEKVLGIQLNLVPTVDDHIIKWCCAEMSISPDVVDFSEMSAFWGKQEAFRLSCRHLFKNLWKTQGQETQVMLLDDVVHDEKFEWPDIHVSGQIFNIDQLTC
jgi:hypothetical protein